MGKKRNNKKHRDADSDTEERQRDSSEKLKQEKSKSKAAFTKARHSLLQLLDEVDLPSRTEVREARKKLDDRLDKVLNDLSSLSTYYEEKMDRANVAKVSREIELIEEEFTAAQNRTQEYLDARKGESSSIASEESCRWRQRHEDALQARRRTEQVEEEMSREQQAIKEEKEKIKRDYIARLNELENRSRQGKESLTRVKAEWTKKQLELEREIDRELGLNCDVKKEDYEKSDIEDDYANDNDSNSNDSSKKAKGSSTTELGHDLWKQLKRVSIPVFSGNKLQYENWKAAFTACIDKAPATPEYKLLQLRQYLSGDALKVIESLGHSASAYEAAKSRLERKYGGKRRQVALYLEEVENLRPLRPGNAKDIEKFADVLDVTVINLKEAGRLEELGNGSLYIKLLKKMTEQMLSQYNRWVYENRMTECVETLRAWVIQEAEFQTIASETLRGLSSKQRDSSHTFFGETAPVFESKDNKNCRVCKKDAHPLWRCSDFKSMNAEDRWSTAKRLGVCYRCLRSNHKGKQCTRSRVCGINGCQGSHDRLLHKERPEKTNSDSRSEPTTSGTEGEPPKPTERSHTTTTVQEKDDNSTENYIALRTVPVVLRKGGRKITVNALLDDASTKTYLNNDVAAELGLQGQSRRVTVSVLNGQEDCFETMPVECELESVDGRLKTTISAFTANRVTGNMRAVNWASASKNWNHLKGINFPNIGPRPIVDILIGIDHADLHYSIKDVRGGPGEPIARLTPLGWTCVGGQKTFEGHAANFNATFFVSSADQDLSTTLQRFWEIESSGTEISKPIYTLEETNATKQVKESLSFKGGRYEVSMPWKADRQDMPDNYNMAVKRLENTEKRLLKNKEVGEAYSNTIKDYIEKGYVSEVDFNTAKEVKGWFLPHFPLVKPDRSTTKVRIIFDASAKHKGVCLNDVIHKGPKLQRELFDVLLRFRRFPFALVGDIAEMYLRIGINPDSRPFHRFLWRDLDTSKTPQVYQFNSLVFGVNSCPFQAQFVSRHHAELNREQYPQAAETVLESTYMDDSMDSAPTEEGCIELYQQLSQLWGSAGMYARKWLSNSERVVREIPEEDRASHVDLSEGYLPSVKTLGVMWVANEDSFTFKTNEPEDSRPLTKRSFLAKTASLFDPMGFLAPFTIRAKILLQEIWTSGIDWDEELFFEHERKARNWLKELESLSEVKIPRCIQLNLEVKSKSLHTFV